MPIWPPTFNDSGTLIAPFERDCTIDRRRGRVETRTIEVSCGMNNYLAPTWPLVRQVARLTRGHWSIENGLHYVRDVSFGEDRSRLRTGSAPQIMAALRNLAITLIHRSGSSQIAASRRHFAAHPREAVTLLLQRRSAQQ